MGAEAGSPNSAGAGLRTGPAAPRWYLRSVRRGFLLAAGFGTRLRPLTNFRPKPLTPVCGVPMLDHAAALLERHGVRSAVVNAHHLPDQVRTWAQDHPMDLEVSVEVPVILGTGGGLRKALPHLADPFVVVNGDILSDVDLGALLDEVDGDVLACMALREKQPEDRYGEVRADATGTVVDLVGLATAEGEPVDGTHFTGVHALSHALVERLPPEGESCIVRQAYVSAVPERRIHATRHAGTWFDVGTPEAYLRANLLACEGTLRLPLDPADRGWIVRRPDREIGAAPAGVELRGPVWIGHGARLEPGCVLGPRAIVGPGARVGSGAVLQDAVVWDGCSVPAGARLERAIVYDGGTLETERRPSASAD